MRSLRIVALLCLAMAIPARAQDKKPPAPATEKKPGAPVAEGKAAPAKTPADMDRTLYAIGVSISKSLEPFSLAPPEVEKVVQGLRDGVAGKPKVQLDDKVQAQVQELYASRRAGVLEKEKTKGSAYLDRMSKEKGAVKTESGAIVIHQKQGTGASPVATDKVKVHYEGTLADGTVFDSSRKRGEPAEFPLNGVVKCWTEALQKMKVGGRAKVVCPSAIAYGEQGRPPVIPGNAVLTFDIELLDIVK
jgi:FKBP-type peptidyl-prolyl cis-trans isomerase